MIELPVEQFGLFAVRKSSVIAGERFGPTGVAQTAQPPDSQDARDDLVATGAFLFSKFVFSDFSWDRERNVDDDARDILVGISENAVAMGTVRLPRPGQFGPGREVAESFRRDRGCVQAGQIAGGVESPPASSSS